MKFPDYMTSANFSDIFADYSSEILDFPANLVHNIFEMLLDLN